MERILVATLVAILLVTPLTGLAIVINVSDIGFGVKEVSAGTAITACDPIEMEVSSSLSGPYSPAGTYGHGDTTLVEPSLWYRLTPHPCSGYSFDHWVVSLSYGGDITDGIGTVEAMISGTQPSRELTSVVITGNRAYVYINEGSSAKVTLYLKRTGHRLTVAVDPVGSGEVSPYGVGVHTLSHGFVVTLNPNAHAGWEFSHWTLDGVAKYTKKLSIKMNSDHKAVAHFNKKERHVTVSIPMPQPIKTCPLPDGWPRSAKYRGYSEDLEYNSDILGNLSGKAGLGEEGNVMFVGWLAVRPQPWSKYNIQLGEGRITMNNSMFISDEHRDFGIVHLTCEGGFNARLAGTTKVGTRAALIWVLENRWKLVDKTLVVVGWNDTDMDGIIQPEELEKVYSVPS